MTRENRLLVTDKLVEFPKFKPVEIQDFRKIADHLRRMYEMCLKLVKKNRKISTCNWFDLETLRYSTNYTPNPPQRLIDAASEVV
jgi:hypothetical protein